MRLFAAVQIPDEIKESLEKFRDGMSRRLKQARSVKWVKTENFHLTLKFFGEIEESRLQDLQKSLLESAKEQKSFSAMVQGIGYFPNAERPRVLWVGILDPANKLRSLAESIELNTVSSNFSPSDKPFSAHLTLARFTAAPSVQFIDAAKEYSSSHFGTFKVEKIDLIRSVLLPEGPQYSVIREFSFNAD